MVAFFHLPQPKNCKCGHVQVQIKRRQGLAKLVAPIPRNKVAIIASLTVDLTGLHLSILEFTVRSLKIKEARLYEIKYVYIYIQYVLRVKAQQPTQRVQ